MGNTPHSIKGGNNSSILQSTEDELNLILVNNNIRSAYLWYEKENRQNPPTLDSSLKDIKQIKRKGLKFKNAFLYYRKDNKEIEQILEKKQIMVDLGKILGYLYPMGELKDGKYELQKDNQFWVSFKLNNILLWSEAAPPNADLNKFGDKLKEIQSVGKYKHFDFANTKMIIEYKYLNWNNAY